MLVMAMTAFSWLWMQWTHEAGHMIAGVATGAKIERVILDPRTFSMTQFESTPYPLVAVWGGPLIGVVLGAAIPLLLAYKFKRLRFELGLITAFVLLANGLYIGIGAFNPVGDAVSMTKHGSPRWTLIMFSMPCLIAARMSLFHAWRHKRTDRMTMTGAVFLSLSAIMAVTGLILFPVS